MFIYYFYILFLYIISIYYYYVLFLYIISIYYFYILLLHIISIYNNSNLIDTETIHYEKQWLICRQSFIN